MTELDARQTLHNIIKDKGIGGVCYDLRFLQDEAHHIQSSPAGHAAHTEGTFKITSTRHH